MSYIALNASSKLTGVVGVGVTTVPVTAGTGTNFAVGSNHSYVTFQNEAGAKETCKITGQSGDNLTVVRTKSVSWAIGDVIECRPCAEAMADYAVAPQITGSAAVAIDDADEMGLVDISASSVLKKITWANVKATLKTYLDTLFLALSGGTLTGKLIFKAGLNNVASAATVDLTGINANTIHITGTTGISAFTMTSGQVVDIVFDSVVALNYHAVTNCVIGGTSVETLPRDRARYWYDGTTVWMLYYERADGSPLFGDLTPSTITADQNDYAPAGLGSASVIRLSSDAARNITGFGWQVRNRTLTLHNVGAYNITLKDESASSVAGNRLALTSDITLTPDTVITIQYDRVSTRWRAVGAPVTAGLTSGTKQNASGSSINFTGIPATAKRITVNYSALSTNGTALWYLQIGDSDGLETTGYLSALETASSRYTSTTGFGLIGVGAASWSMNGRVVLELLDPATNTWIAEIMSADSSGGANYSGAGSKALTGTLDRLSLVTTDTWDAGMANILYE